MSIKSAIFAMKFTPIFNQNKISYTNETKFPLSFNRYLSFRYDGINECLQKKTKKAKPSY
jgi:hypothetical protein